MQLADDYTKRKSRGKVDYCLAGVEQGTFRDSAPACASLDLGESTVPTMHPLGRPSKSRTEDE
jgi:hypothetical protein